MNKSILINALGVVDSGGVVVLDKTLKECSAEKSNTFFIVCNKNKNTKWLKTKYKNFNFIFVKGGIFYRIFYENIVFGRLVRSYEIQLIYNFSGSAQLNVFIKTLQLTKIHNLLFYSRGLDNVYHSKNAHFAWLKQIFLKRMYFKLMLGQSKYIEVQSKHVKDSLSDFISIEKKIFYIKSDVNVSSKSFAPPKEYNFSKKIKFLYIVGPHFESIHKNFVVFVEAMSELDKLNIDYEINITLTKDQLHNSKIWDAALNSNTNFLGYIDNKGKMNKLFFDNTILISTSIIETLGLHVIEGIKKGVITIAPSENYSRAVYSDQMILYDTLSSDSLLNEIQTVLKSDMCSELILSLQDRLKKSETAKYYNILDIFEEVLNVQK